MSSRTILLANNTVIVRTAIALSRLADDTTVPAPVRAQLDNEVERLRYQEQKNRRVMTAHEVIAQDGEIE